MGGTRGGARVRSWERILDFLPVSGVYSRLLARIGPVRSGTVAPATGFPIP